MTETTNPNAPIIAGARGAAAIARALVAVAVFAAPIVVAICTVGVVAFAGATVRALFVNHLGAHDGMAWLAVFASVGMALAMLGVIVLNRTHTLVEGLGGIYLILFAFIVLVLCSLNTALDAQKLNLLAFTVPPQLSNIGSLVAAILAAIGIVPVITLPLANWAVPADKFPSAAAAIGFVVSVIAKSVGVIASSLGTFYFGYARTGNAFLSAFVAFLYESCFLWAYLAFTRARQQRDVFDRVLWGVLMLVFGAFIASVSIEALSTLAGSKIVPDWLHAWGETLYVSAVGVTVLLTVLAHLLTEQISFTVDDVRAWWAARRARQTSSPRVRLAKDSGTTSTTSNQDNGNSVPNGEHERMPRGDPYNLHKGNVRKCAQCGKEFIGKTRSKYCSARCKKRALRARSL